MAIQPGMRDIYLRTLVVVVFTTALFAANGSRAAAPDPLVAQEVAHLLKYVKESDCSFYRNGGWYDSARTARHLSTKYDYMAKRYGIKSTEHFINEAAARSSVTGQPYKIKCGQEKPVASADWLNEELRRYRQSRSAQRPD